MQEILLTGGIVLSLNRAKPLALGRGQVEEDCYGYVLGHFATNTLQHNKFEAKHAKTIFFEILQTILELTAYGCFWKPHLFLHLHHQAVTGWCFGAASPSLLQKESIVTAYCTVWGPTHSTPRNKFWDYHTETAHRKCVCNSSALWILPSSGEEHGSIFRFLLLKHFLFLCPRISGRTMPLPPLNALLVNVLHYVYCWKRKWKADSSWSLIVLLSVNLQDWQKSCYMGNEYFSTGFAYNLLY